jgi:hypothetical protein
VTFGYYFREGKRLIRPALGFSSEFTEKINGGSPLLITKYYNTLSSQCVVFVPVPIAPIAQVRPGVSVASTMAAAIAQAKPMTSQITLNLDQGALRFDFSPQAAQGLQQALTEVMQGLKTRTLQAGDPAPKSQEPPMEYQHAGEVFLEVFCNPNIWASPFAAKALVTLRDDRIRITTEAELNRLYEDVLTYLDQQPA